MRERKICPKCQHNHILLVERVPDVGDTYGDIKRLSIATIFLGEGFFGEKIGTAGELSAAVCRRCGYCELYVNQPDLIPIDGEYVREVVGPEPITPYR